MLPLRLSIKWSEPRQNIIKQTLFCLPCAKGAGLRWRPLHCCAEAPTEPGGETVATQRVDGGIEKKLGHRVQAFLAFFVFCLRAVPSYSSHSQENEIQLHFSKSVSV